jgi:hypothetical protein
MLNRKEWEMSFEFHERNTYVHGTVFFVPIIDKVGGFGRVKRGPVIQFFARVKTWIVSWIPSPLPWSVFIPDGPAKY